jgi:hypothetical protein
MKSQNSNTTPKIAGIKKPTPSLISAISSKYNSLKRTENGRFAKVSLLNVLNETGHQLKDLQNAGMKIDKKTYRKYEDNNYTFEKKSAGPKITNFFDEIRQWVRSYLEENSRPSSHRTVKIENKFIPIRILNASVKDLHENLLLTEEYENFKKRSPVKFTLSDSFFYKMINEFKIFSKPKKSEKEEEEEKEASLPEIKSKKSTLEENTHKNTPLGRDMKTIIISPLSKTITAGQLTDIFSKCGLIENIHFKWIDFAKGIHTNRVDIEFKTKEALENALKMDQMLLRGYPITIKQKARYVAFVSGLPEMNTTHLESHFSKCGRCQVYREKPGTASIHFYFKDSFDLAISMSGTKIFGNTIKVIDASLSDVNPEMGSKKIARVPEEVKKIPKSIPKKNVISKLEFSEEDESSEEESSSDESSSDEESSSEEEIPKSTSKKRTLEGVEEPKTKIQKTNNGSKQQDEFEEMENELEEMENELKEMENELTMKEFELKRKELDLKMKEMEIKENELRLKEENLKIKEKKSEK